MKVIIFGATGRTGKELVEQALEKGYQVTAFARNPKKVVLEHDNLKVIQGDVLKLQDVEQAIGGHDAVLCSIGLPSIMDRSELRRKGTKNIVLGMKLNSVKRLVCQSSLGVGDSYQFLPMRYRYFIAPLFMRRAFSDHLNQEQEIKQSQLDWSIIRPGALTDGEATSSYYISCEKVEEAKEIKVSRSDTAQCMIKELEEKRFLHQTPHVTY